MDHGATARPMDRGQLARSNRFNKLRFGLGCERSGSESYKGPLIRFVASICGSRPRFITQRTRILISLSLKRSERKISLTAKWIFEGGGSGESPTVTARVCVVCETVLSFPLKLNAHHIATSGALLTDRYMDWIKAASHQVVESEREVWMEE